MADAAKAVAVTKDGKVDPLKLLRASTIKGVRVPIRKDNLMFDEGQVSRYAPCGFRMGQAQDLVDIGSVWYMLRGTLTSKTYSQEDAERHGFVYIGVLHRVDLIEYLRGKTETCNGLIKNPPLVDLSVSQRADETDGAAAKRRKTEVQIGLSDVHTLVRPVKDLDVALRCPGREVPNADLILKIAKDELRHWWNRPVEKITPEIPGKVPLIQEIQNMQRDRPNEEVLPIILVPLNKSAPINLLNVCRFLQDGVFAPPEHEQVKFFESTRPEEQKITRNMCGKEITFRIKDYTKGFTKSDWLATVAVIVDGKLWQFKGWPFESYIDLFTTMKGFFFQLPSLDLKTVVPQETISKWKVEVLKLKTSRHHDVALRDRFFESLEAFLMAGRMKKFRSDRSLG
eukprot:gnl/MRDRNA2_/MRDRNA2_148039_c0_seq1.p1 gnl/MRDRNA2_/MRDRNA2_148039_c0~~gnl/MRDRNA2_/MRDRNA2_148039_c0_seq1.p1  ORF type:complete len:398 (+),score=67.83 gnl/MRDRNA2_/MRDRNA2_148039_c0_seq1:96-1289(+)